MVARRSSCDGGWAVTELPRSPLSSLLYAFPLPQLRPAAESTLPMTARARAEDDGSEAQGNGGDFAQHGGGTQLQHPSRALSFSTTDLLSL
ncbi:uncharacterized protein DS421_13g421660 [Arachis hypogaea]|nr:uncharacterized protein DS421_13g421660 [Arachis hypogaea]